MRRKLSQECSFLIASTKESSHLELFRFGVLLQKRKFVYCTIEEEGLKISHASAILRHLARYMNSIICYCKEKLGCMDAMNVKGLCVICGIPKSKRCHNLIDNSKVQNELWKADFVQKDNISDFKVNEMKIKFFNEVMVQELAYMAEMMSANESPFIVGNQLTFVDIKVTHKMNNTKLFSFLEALDKEFKLALPSFPIFEAFREFIGRRPKISSLTKLGKRY